MTLLRTTFWMGILVCIKIMSVFLTSKIIAVYIGPIGLALVEQFQNIIQIIRTFSANLIQKGVIKYVSEYRNNPIEKSKILSSALIFSIAISIILGFFLISFSSQIAEVTLESISFRNIVILLAATLILFSLNNLFLAILNAELEIKKYVLSNIVNTLLFIACTIFLVIYFGVFGALLSLVINQSLIFFFTGGLVITSKWFRWKDFFKGVHYDSLSKLITYAFIMIVTTLSLPIAQLVIRNYVAHSLSWEEAGYWQGMTKLSTNYAILLDTLFSTYYLPKLSSVNSDTDLKNEIKNYYRFLIPISVFIAFIIYGLKSQITIIMFSKAFLPMTVLFKYQLVGDIAKVASWILSYIMIAKTMIKELFITECLFLFFYTISSCLFIHNFGLIGSSIAFSLSYIFYCVVMIYFVYKHIKVKNKNVSSTLIDNYVENLT